MNKFSKLAGCKIDIQNPAVFLYTSHEQSKNKIKTIIPFTITKIFRNKFNKRSKDLHTENYTTALYIKEDLNKHINIPYSRIRRLNIAKMARLPN